MDTFALFEDGMASKILLDFFEPEKHHIDAESVQIDDAQVVRSAIRGFYATYKVLRHWGYIAKEKYCFSYEFEGEFYSFGSSAGLAFCLKFAQEIYRHTTGKELPYCVAATGVVSNGTRHARITPVDGMHAKFCAALGCLGEDKGDKLLFPAENEAQITRVLREQAAEKGIALIPVKTVEEALISLLGHALQVCPIEIEGLGPPVVAPGTYEVVWRRLMGRSRQVPFKIINTSGVPVNVQATWHPSAPRWLQCPLTTVTIPAHATAPAGLSTRLSPRLAFLLRHGWRLRFTHAAQLALHCRIRAPQPYECTRHICVRWRCFNPWAVIMPMLLLLALLRPPLPPPPCSGSWRCSCNAETFLRQLEQGQCRETKAQVEACLQDVSRPDERLMALQRQIEAPLHLTSNLRALPRPRSSGVNPSPAPGRLTLISGDAFKVDITPGAEMFLYVYHDDPRGEVWQLFPNSEASPGPNPLQAGRTYMLPASDPGFVLDEHTGRETLHFVASRWQARDLEALVDHVRHASHAVEQPGYRSTRAMILETVLSLGKETRPERYRRQLFERLAIRQQAQAAGIGGCFYAEYSFEHVAP